jgi:hypothetical protein
VDTTGTTRQKIDRKTERGEEEEHIPARIIGGEKETGTKGVFFLTLAMYNKQLGSQREACDDC